MTQQALMDAFGFTDADLVANRAGKMTAAQQVVLRHNRLVYLMGYGLGATISLSVFGASIVHFDSYTSGTLLNSVMITLISGALFAVFAVVTVSKVRKIQIDIKEANVGIAKGQISLLLLDPRNMIYQLEIGNMRLNIAQKAILVLRKQQDHAVYYAPRSKIVLAIEEL